MSTLCDRFWAKVDKSGPGGCWLWTASTDGHGYGKIGLGGRGAGEGLAHRVVMEWEAGRALSSAECVLHRCDVPRCVNPEHLWIGTKRENSQDMVRKGRNRPSGVQGEAHPMAKLTWELVQEIRESFAAGGVTRHELAEQYDVSKSTIAMLIRGETW